VSQVQYRSSNADIDTIAMSVTFHLGWTVQSFVVIVVQMGLCENVTHSCKLFLNEMFVNPSRPSTEEIVCSLFNKLYNSQVV
jgi:hypothetical protein